MPKNKGISAHRSRREWDQLLASKGEGAKVWYDEQGVDEKGNSIQSLSINELITRAFEKTRQEHREVEIFFNRATQQVVLPTYIGTDAHITAYPEIYLRVPEKERGDLHTHPHDGECVLSGGDIQEAGQIHDKIMILACEDKQEMVSVKLDSFSEQELVNIGKALDQAKTDQVWNDIYTVFMQKAQPITGRHFGKFDRYSLKF